jgi:hypothetical protein
MSVTIEGDFTKTGKVDGTANAAETSVTNASISFAGLTTTAIATAADNLGAGTGDVKVVQDTTDTTKLNLTVNGTVVGTATPTFSATQNAVDTVTFTSTDGNNTALGSISVKNVDTATAVTAVAVTGFATAVDSGLDYTAPGTDPVSNTYNFQTTNVDNKTADNQYTLASTYFDLTDDMVADGNRLRIGDKYYEFTSDTTKTNGAATTDGKAVYVDASSGDLGTIAQKLTAAVAGKNTVYTVGADAKQAGRISLVEK